MIKKVSEVLDQLNDPQYKGWGEEILSMWAKEIISECSNVAKVDVVYEIEDNSEEGYHEEIQTTDYWSLGAAWKVRPNKSEILNMINQLK